MRDDRDTFLEDGYIVIRYCDSDDRFIFSGDEIGDGSVIDKLLTENRKKQFDNKDFSRGFTLDELVLTLNYLGKRMKLPFSIALWVANQQNKTKEVN